MHSFHGIVEIQIGWDSVMRMSADLRDLFLYEAFLYYNPLLLVVSEFQLSKCLFNIFLTIIIVTFYTNKIFSFGTADYDGVAVGN